MLGKLRFLISKRNPLRRSCVLMAWNAGKVAFPDFHVQPSAEIVRVRGMLVKLRFPKCNHLRRLCASIAQNAGKVAFSDFRAQPSAEIVRVHSAECRTSCAFVTRKVIFYKWILMQGSWHGHLAQKTLIQRSCACGPTGSCCRDPSTENLHQDIEILHGGPAYRGLSQMVLQDPDAKILTKRS